MLLSIFLGEGALLFAAMLASLARAESRERSSRRPTRAARRAPRGTLAGMPLHILLSERSGPGALLRDTLLHRPSSREGRY
jgi:DNA invertase Pin-like site-specific DNA recombinase